MQVMMLNFTARANLGENDWFIAFQGKILVSCTKVVAYQCLDFSKYYGLKHVMSGH